MLGIIDRTWLTQQAGNWLSNFCQNIWGAQREWVPISSHHGQMLIDPSHEISFSFWKEIQPKSSCRLLVTQLVTVRTAGNIWTLHFNIKIATLKEKSLIWLVCQTGTSFCWILKWFRKFVMSVKVTDGPWHILSIVLKIFEHCLIIGSGYEANRPVLSQK